MAYALDVLEARGDLDPDSPEAAAFVEAYLKDVTMHEVGHTLGLRHNFRSSRAYTLKQLADPAFTRANGITGSVMDYAPINLNGPTSRAPPTARRSATPSGPYDYWAIEFAYKPLPDGLSPAEEKAALEKIAGRSAEPQLAYGTDEDNFLGIDPESLQNDLGNDAIGFAKKRIAIAQDLLKRQEARQLRPDQDYNLLKRSVSYAIRDVARAANVLSRQIGGVRTVRDAPGTGRDPLAPVPVAEQREALDVITGSLLSADSLRVSPTLQRKLATDFSERWEALRGGEGSAQTDYSPSEQVLGLQRSLLAGADERHRRHAPPRKQREGAGRHRPRPAHARALQPPVAGGLERARRQRRHRAAAPRGAARPRQPHLGDADRRAPRTRADTAQHRPRPRPKSCSSGSRVASTAAAGLSERPGHSRRQRATR
jgi:hypothetical protein